MNNITIKDDDIKTGENCKIYMSVNLLCKTSSKNLALATPRILENKTPGSQVKV